VTSGQLVLTTLKKPIFDCHDSVIPTRYFLGRPDVGEEMHISIEKGKTLIIRLMAIGPVVEGRAQRDVWFEVNGEVCKGSLTFIQLSTICVDLGPPSSC